MYDFKPVMSYTYDCIEEVFYTLAQGAAGDFHLLNTNSFRFDFDVNKSRDKKISSKLSFDNEYKDIIANLNKYYGITSAFTKSENLSHMTDIINRKLQEDLPVPVCNDRMHYMIITGYDREKGYRVVDSLRSGSYALYIPKEEVDKIITNEYIDISYSGMAEGTCDWKTALQTILNNGEEIVLTGLKQFKDYLASDFDFSEEVSTSHDIEMLPLLRSMRKVSGSRRYFYHSLLALSHKSESPLLENLAEDFLQSVNTWDALVGVFTKMLFLPDQSVFIRKIIKRLDEILDIEERFIINLRKLAVNNSLDSSLSGCKTGKKAHWNDVHKTVHVDIARFCNNKALGGGDEEADYDGDNYYFVKKDFFTQSAPKETAAYFSRAFLSSEGFDNISCNEQYIPVERGKYSILYILASAEMDNYSSFITLSYTDGSEEKIPLEFSDWWNDPVFGELVAYDVSCARKEDGREKIIGDSVSLFAQAWEIDNKKELNGIHLPFCLNIHIFSFSLGT